MSSGLPIVSVIIAAREEAGHIEGCIEALAQQTYPGELLEVLLVDGASKDDTVCLATTCAAALGLALRVIDNPARVTMLAPRLIFWDEEAARRSARRIVDACRTIYPGHDRPFVVEPGGFRYIEPTSLVVTFAPRDDDGRLLASFSDEPPADAPIIMPSARRSAGAGTGDG